MNWFDQISRALDQQLRLALDKAIRFSKEKIEEKTPEDTKKLVWDYELTALQVVWDVYSRKVINRTPYAFYVEFGVRSAIYAYNKPKGTIFKIWVGARMMTLTKEENLEDIKKIITDSVVAIVK